MSPCLPRSPGGVLFPSFSGSCIKWGADDDGLLLHHGAAWHEESLQVAASFCPLMKNINCCNFLNLTFPESFCNQLVAVSC